MASEDQQHHSAHVVTIQQNRYLRNQPTRKNRRQYEVRRDDPIAAKSEPESAYLRVIRGWTPRPSGYETCYFRATGRDRLTEVDRFGCLA